MLKNTMYSLSVQGAGASSFEFKNNSGHEFRSFVENLTMNCATIICSRYRTDLFYFSKDDHQDEIMRVWCSMTSKKFSPAIRNKFIKASGEKEVLQLYFTSLQYLARIPDWFYLYNNQFNLALNFENNHPIHREILGCANYLAAINISENLLIIPNTKLKNRYILSKNNKFFASEAAKNYLKN